ncbi:MAG: CPBP family intramembrane glutamic endopeptidase, partial [Bacteroidales bacterium]|nr:CPBP family intramembrane glutamic endopeptidase [Bacteroidales bacterium]
AVIVAAILFSAIHFQFYGFVPRVLLGAFFGYLVILTNSIWPAVWAHFLNNSIAVVSYFVFGNDISGIDDLGIANHNTIFVIVSIIISAILMYFLFRKSKSVLQ